MLQPETCSSIHALQSQPSLVLVAPMPRRPIALVARRHHHHHGSRSRSSRTVSTSQSEDSSKDSAAQRSATSPDSESAVGGCSASSVRLVGHPYSRAKTPSNANAGSNPVSPAAASGWPLGLGISPVSPPPRSRAASREGIAPCPLSRLSLREGTTTLPLTLEAVAVSRSPSLGQVVDDQAADVSNASIADEPMLASPIAPSTFGFAVPMMDVERTPTKRNSRAQLSSKHVASPIQARYNTAAVDNDQESRSMPTIGATLPRPDNDDKRLTLSSTSPSHQCSTAQLPQLPLSPSSPPAPSPIHDTAANNKAAAVQERIKGHNATASASVAPSPCLSESHSRSPTASPSPCPSPSFVTLSDLPKPEEESQQQQHRKMGLPLPPIPTSPIPRKMTRNPFERYITTRDGRGSGCSGSMTLHTRLALAMANGGKHGHLAVGAGEFDEEMNTVSPTLHRPVFVSVNSSNSVGSRMDMVD
ncbi:hypothetical protein NDA18_004111 [Ustilago nuda]|nr:hypothetical protein NDA18_004111 [Ustilago nuda]